MTTVAELLTNSLPAGERVAVRGTCIGYSRVVAMGPQPRTRSDWQLLDGSDAIWVVGPYPTGCSGTVPSEVPDTFAMTVAVDTLPALGTRAQRARTYLLYSTP